MFNFLPLLSTTNTSWQVDRELGADSMPVWAMFFLFIAALLYVGLIYYLDGRKSPTWMRIFLASLRILVLVVAFIILLGPILVERKTSVEKSTVIVLVDDSLSMGHGDPLLEPGALEAYRKVIDPDTKLKVKPVTPGAADEEVMMKEIKEDQFKRVPRIDLVNAVLSAKQATPNFLKELSENHQVFLYHFGDSVGPWSGAKPAGAEVPETTEKAKAVAGDTPVHFEAYSPSTRLAAALRTVRNERKTYSLAGVVLISDGQETESPEAVRLESKAFDKLELPLPVHTVMVGSPKPPRDAAIVRARGNAKLNEGDNMVVSFYVKHANLPSSLFAPEKPMLGLIDEKDQVLDVKPIEGYDSSDQTPVKVTFTLPTPTVVSAQGTDTHLWKARIKNNLSQWDNNPANNIKDFFFTVSKR
ncbi:MAG TPA: hypothetical protein VL860_06345, partial [Planctomycetota bacterium]|nr:hypothetical protein [Planctomycetota bacterium]